MTEGKMNIDSKRCPRNYNLENIIDSSLLWSPLQLSQEARNKGHAVTRVSHNVMALKYNEWQS